MSLTVRVNLAARGTSLRSQSLMLLTGLPRRCAGAGWQGSESSGARRGGQLEHDKLHFVSSPITPEASESEKAPKIDLMWPYAPGYPEAPWQSILWCHQIFPLLIPNISGPFRNSASATWLQTQGDKHTVKTWTWMHLHCQRLQWARAGDHRSQPDFTADSPAWPEHNPTVHWQWLRAAWGRLGSTDPLTCWDRAGETRRNLGAQNTMLAALSHPPKTSGAWLLQNSRSDSLYR